MSSSTKSKPASRAAAQKAALTSFASDSLLPFDADPATVLPERDGRSRLKGAFLIRTEMVEPDPEQPRKVFDADELAGLAATLKSRGFQQILKVHTVSGSGKYRLVDGERRWRAALLAGIAEVPCWVYDGQASDRDIFLDQIIANEQRVDLQPYETADAMVRLRDQFGMTAGDIASMTGKSKGEVSKLLALVDKVEPSVQERVRTLPNVSLTKRHLYMLSQLPPREQVRMATKIEREHLTVPETERIIGHARGDKQAVRAGRHFAYKVAQAFVTVRFDKREVTPDEVLYALAEARRLAAEEFAEQS